MLAVLLELLDEEDDEEDDADEKDLLQMTEAEMMGPFVAVADDETTVDDGPEGACGEK